MTERRSFLKALAALPAAPAPTSREVPRARVRHGLGFLVLPVKFTERQTGNYLNPREHGPCPELDDLVERFWKGVEEISRTPDIYHPMEIHVYKADGSEWGGHLLRPVPEGAGLVGMDHRHKEVPYRLDPVRIFRGEWDDIRRVVPSRERQDQLAQIAKIYESREWARMNAPVVTHLDRREIAQITVSFHHVL
jgi:hypothetical protein